MYGIALAKSLLLVSLWLLLFITATGREHHSYPKGVHHMVVQRLNKLRSESSKNFGTWGLWSSWSPCSRSCGTGVSTQSRECRTGQHRKRKLMSSSSIKEGSRCVGRYKRFQLCNPQECPGGYKDFRKEQCEAYNKTPFDRKLYKWEPYIDAANSCSLNCRAIGLSFYATLNQSVIDGTPCGMFHPQKRIHNRICVGGKCMKIGCDGVLGSGRVIDACGKCGGDNTSCKVIAGVYSRSQLPFGYNLIATLPPRAENISIYHVSPSPNYLALRELGGSYILNGPWGVNSTGSFGAAGAVFSYGRPQPFKGDYIYSSGPLGHSIDIMLFYQSDNPGIKYEYRVPLKTTLDPTVVENSIPNKNQYGFATQRRPLTTSVYRGPINDESISISANFGHPVTNRTSSRHSRKRHKKDYYGPPGGKKKNKKSRRKKYVWIPKGFTQCSHTCGGGIRKTRFVCVKKNAQEKEVPPHFCLDTPPPQDEISCNDDACPPAWYPDDWLPCSVTCGLGVQLRHLTCKKKILKNKFVTLENTECDQAPIVPRAQVCQTPECDGPPRWEVGPWSQCSKMCGIGMVTRKVQCTNGRGILPHHVCPNQKPTSEQMCDMGSCASDTWFSSAWSDRCLGPCGKGLQSRSVYCSGDATGGSFTDSNSCPKKRKPSETRPCSVTTDCEGSWFTGSWSDCSVHCGSGLQRRAVLCILWNRSKYKVTDEKKCKASGPKPEDSQPCTVECKAEWFTSEWSECSVPCGEGGVQRREVKCLGGSMRHSLACSSATKPDSRQSCNTQSCDKNTKNILSKPFQNDPSDTSESVTTKIKPSSPPSDLCIDRMKNCNLVFKARLCKLKYYNRLCCETCKTHSS